MNKIITYNFGLYHPSIYISDLQSIINLEKKNNIVILSFMGKNPFENIINDKNVQYYFFKVNDFPWENINTLFPITYNIIHNSLLYGKDIYIHCRMGVSRSVTILISFFLTCLQKSPQLVIPFIPKTRNTWTDSILYWIQQKRSIANPNNGFMRQLYDYEKELLS